MKKTILFAIFGLLLIFTATQVLAQGTEINEIHLFEQRGCPDCARAKEFIENEIKPNYPNVEITIYSIMDSSNQEIFHEMMKERGIEDYTLIVPTIFIGDNYFQNFFEADKELIERAIKGEDVQKEIYAVRGDAVVSVPFIGNVNISDFSLPVLAVIIGTVDGLNVCSIGALILILTLVLASFKSRKKIILFGGLFILTTVLVYGLLIFAWTALFHALASYMSGLNILIGLAALIGGGFFFKKFIDFYKYGPGCEYSSNKYLAKATKKLKKLFSENQKTTLLLSGVVLFAFIVTIVELPCSFGLPMIYAGVLAAEGLTLTGYILYVLLYLFFYMLIELIIFAGVVITREMFFTESKWITWIYLFGSLVLFALSYNYLIGF
jgi:glutaredoxin/cytochrome c biogenesis protein CcdA